MHKSVMTTQKHHQTFIRAGVPWWHVDWRELCEYHDLLFLLVKRDLTATYKQTLLGPLWFVIQPLVTTLVFTIIFGKVAKISTDGVPQIIFYMSGIVVWNYFQGVLTHGSGALIANSGLFSKVYFPRLIVPLSGVLTNLAHFLLNYIMFLGFYFYFLFFTKSGMIPNSMLAAIPLLIFQCALIGLGCGLWVAALTAKYRDLHFALPFFIQLGMYATPIVYPASLVVDSRWKIFLWLNPMTSVVEINRYALTSQGVLFFPGIVLGFVVTLFVLVSGLFLFNKIQRTFVDTI